MTGPIETGAKKKPEQGWLDDGLVGKQDFCPYAKSPWTPCARKYGVMCMTIDNGCAGCGRRRWRKSEE